MLYENYRKSDYEYFIFLKSNSLFQKCLWYKLEHEQEDKNIPNFILLFLLEMKKQVYSKNHYCVVVFNIKQCLKIE